MSIRPLFTHQDRLVASSPERTRAGVSAPSDAAPGKAVAASRPKDNSVWAMLAMWLAFALACLAVSTVSAQQANFPYESLPMHPKLQDEAVLKGVKAATKSYATTGSGDPRMAVGYFSIYVPAKMTAPDGIKHITELVEETTSLLSRAQRSNRPQVAQQLTRAIFDGMKKVAEGNYHPAARINAALVLAQLDRQPANPATRTPPVPLLETLPILISLYEDESNADGVRAAALQGLHRHVMYGFPQIAPDVRTKISGMMTSLLDASPPQGRPADAHAYLQRYAVDILDVLRNKQDASLGTKLVSISTEPSKPDLIAFYSASRLASMGPELQGQIQTPKQVLQSWSQRVLAAFESELERLDDYLKKPEAARGQPVKPESLLQKKTTETASTRKPRAGGNMEDMMNMDMDYENMMMSDMDMSMGMEDMQMDMMMMYGQQRATEKPQPPEVIASRKKLNHILQQIHLGVTGQATAGLPSRNPGGILASIPDNQKAVVEDWVTQMEGVVTTLNDKTLDDAKKFREGLAAQVEILREIAGVEAEEAGGAGELPEELAPVDPLAELAPVNPAAANNNAQGNLVAP